MPAARLLRMVALTTEAKACWPMFMPRPEPGMPSCPVSSMVMLSSAAVDSITIEDTGQDGIPGSGLGMNIGQHAFASVVNATIRNNRAAGILVHENSGVRIGFVDVATIVAGNRIADNGRGIVIEESAQARVVGTTISGNKGFGIYVARGSHLEL